MNTTIGIRVKGHDLDKVVHASDEIAAVVKRIPGAVDVVADPIRGKPYLEIRFDRERAARLGVSVGEANEVIEAALAGKPVTIRPMAAPVLGGILVADEVVDLLIPVLFYGVRRWRWRRLHPQSILQETQHPAELVQSSIGHPGGGLDQKAMGAIQTPAP